MPLKFALVAAVFAATLTATPVCGAASTNPDDTRIVTPDSGPTGDSARFAIHEQSAELLFRALGTEIGKPIKLSRKAQRPHISGKFDLSHPFDVIESITLSLGLVWYFDGQAIYVYDGSETESAILALSAGQTRQLIEFLKHSALYDPRFPISAKAKGLVYVAGPPKYLEIVRAAARLLEPAPAATDSVFGGDSEKPQVEVIRLRYISVDNRRYEQRNRETWIPGLAAVLSDIWNNEVDLKVAGRPDVPKGSAPAAPSPVDPAKDLLPRLPPGVGELPAPDTAPETRPAAFPNDRRLHIVAYPNNNSLLLSGSPSQLRAARALIAQLDVPKRQVELSLWVIDISRTNLDALGAQWSGEAGLGSVGIAFNAPNGGLGSTLNPGDTARFIASVSALSEKNKARIVSRPIILAQDNSPALFDSSRTFYVKLEGERQVALETVTYGTMINVVPRILDDSGPIEMELEIEDGSSSNPGSKSGLDLPEVSRTQIRTVARVQGEQSLLVGGYTHAEQRRRENKIPLLGDIPFVGGLFRYRSDGDANTVRLFLIQPRLLADGETFDTASLKPPKAIDNAVDALKKLVVRHDG